MDLRQMAVLAVCGYSGAGKTTLILDLIGRMRARGLSVLVIKHDAHGLTVDRQGKDSARFFDAGADVLARDPKQGFLRTHAGAEADLASLLRQWAFHQDVILVEGHKATPLPHKIWLRRNARDGAPEAFGPMLLDLGRAPNRGQIAWAFIDPWIDHIHRQTPLMAGILIGGQSRRMGQPKHLMLDRGRTWLARIAAALRPVVDGVVVLGAGRVPLSCAALPRLPDIPGCSGPMAGLRAATRWQREARWIFTACDTPRITTEAVRWLASQARPGIWAVQARTDPRTPAQPFPGLYDPRAALALEAASGPSFLARLPRTATPLVPAALRAAWRDFDTKNSLERSRANDGAGSAAKT